MKNELETIKLLSDETRLRILMLLEKKELCVCQMMGILGVSQPLVSRNLSLLSKGDFLDERRDGKLIFYKVKNNLSEVQKKAMKFLTSIFQNDRIIENDLKTLTECKEYQKLTGRCDMATFKEFMKGRSRSHQQEETHE